MSKIAIVLNASWNVYNFRLPLLEFLAGQGHDITVLAPVDDYSDKIPFEFIPIKMQPSSLNPIADLLLIRDLYSVFKQNRPDVALLYTIKSNVYANFAAKLAGVETISNISGLGSIFINKRFTTVIAKLLYRLALKHPATVFFQNANDQQLFVEHGLVNTNKCRVIPGSGIDINKFSPIKTSAKNTRGKFIFLVVARMLWDKGIGEFIEAAKAILKQRQDVEFKLLGQTDAENPAAISYQHLLEMTTIDGLEYIGISDCVEKVMAKVDCVVLPSYREGLSRVLLEAAALGLPIVTTNVPGCLDVVEDGINGLLCEPRDTVDLKEKMLTMLSLTGKQRTKMGLKGREKVIQYYDQKHVFIHYRDAVNQILQK